MKRISRKNRYISDLVWEKDHFETEVKRVREQCIAKPLGHPSRTIWYLGDTFTISEANKRIKELTAEIEHVQSDDSYTPWKDDFDFEKHTIEDIKRNLDEQEIELTPYEKSVEVHKKRIKAMGPEPFDDASQEEISQQDMCDSMGIEKELPTDPNILYPCPSCGKPTANWGGSGVCRTCDEDGIWVDPAGGIHTDNEEDSAAQYE